LKMKPIWPGVQHDGNGGLDFSLPSYEDCE